LEHGFSRARCLADDLVSSSALAYLQHRIGKTKLFEQRRAQWATGYDMTIADAIACIDHDQGIVDVNARALEAVVHDDEITAMIEQEPRAGRAVRRHRDRRMHCQKQRLIADMGGAVVFG